MRLPWALAGGAGDPYPCWPEMARKKSNKLKDPAAQSPRIVNRRARHDFHIHEKIEVGIALQGSEVKSVRQGRVALTEAFGRVDPQTTELWLINAHIAEYNHAHGANSHDPLRPRKLLAHKREIGRLAGLASSQGRTLVPLAMYFVRGKVKVELGVASGKKQYDKRQDLKSRDADREIRRAMTRKRL